ncbi:MAG: glutamate-5-semialdehyde dehydrogenase [Lachnospiraceae bacterium]|nr:glutamate-5-semialdehyde dehydrogenase [Lachnospiraceae bacterium]
MTITEKAMLLKKDSTRLAAAGVDLRNKALNDICNALIDGSAEIFEANKKDLKDAEENGLAPAVMKRLKFDENKLHASVEGIKALIGLKDPLNIITLKRQLDEGLTLVRSTCPIGVIGMIFEARPDALIQISTLCIKSGNCCILKGGSETKRTNKALFDIIYKAACLAGLPEGCMAQAEERSEINELLTCDKYVDLIIPRGSNSFVRFCMDNTKIPVMGHADGICHIYVSAEADPDMAISCIIDAKTQYSAVCNAVETVLVDKSIAEKFLPLLSESLKKARVKQNGNAEVQKIIYCNLIDEDGYKKEYLDKEISLKIVSGIDEAISHINTYGSHHTDCIITKNESLKEYFFTMVDSANVYCNCSTRFADGFRYGFGAEVGISTGKMPPRGPVGLEGLVTYKYKLTGEGHIVAPYCDGTKNFNFEDLQ